MAELHGNGPWDFLSKAVGSETADLLLGTLYESVVAICWGGGVIHILRNKFERSTEEQILLTGIRIPLLDFFITLAVLLVSFVAVSLPTLYSFVLFVDNEEREWLGAIVVWHVVHAIVIFMWLVVAILFGVLLNLHVRQLPDVLLCVVVFALAVPILRSVWTYFFNTEPWALNALFLVPVVGAWLYWSFRTPILPDKDI